MGAKQARHRQLREILSELRSIEQEILQGDRGAGGDAAMSRTVNWRAALARIGLQAQIEAQACIDGSQLRFVHLAVATADALFVD